MFSFFLRKIRLKRTLFASLVPVLLTGLLVVSCSQPTNGGNMVNAKTPSITGQPQDGTWDVDEEDTFALTVTASSPDGGSLSYQWYKGTSASTTTGGATIGTDNKTLTLEKAHYPGDGALYFYVVVTNTINDNGDGGVKTATTTSAVATVTVTGNGVEMVNAEQPSITGQPTGGTWNVANVTSHTLTVTAAVTDGGTLSYQWYKNTTNSTTGGATIGTNDKSLTLAKADYTSDGAYYFYVVVTNTITDNGDGGVKNAAATSTVATVTVNGNDGGITVNAQQPSITGQPTGGTWNVSNANTFPLTVTASVTDGGTLSYQWYKNTTNSTTGGEEVGTDNAALTLEKAHYTGDGNLYFYVVVTNTNNGVNGNKTVAATSDVATVTVTGNGVAMVNAQQPSITVQPAGGTWNVANVASHTLTVTATVTDGGTLSYQWYKNTTNTTTGGTTIGTNNAVLTLAKTDYTDDGAYYFYVAITNTIADNNDGGVKSVTATSNVAMVTVSGNPLTINIDAAFAGGPGAQKTVAIKQTITGNLSKSGNGSITLTITDSSFTRYEWYVGRTKVGDNSVTLQAANANLKVGSNLITAVAYVNNTPWSADFTVYVTE